MRVLIGCEESQEVCMAFRRHGHEAYSCDLVECSGGHPEWHIQGDIGRILHETCGEWDLIILHPPCDCLALSGNRWYGSNTPGFHKRVAAIEWTVGIWCMATRQCKRVALENPTSVIFKHLYADDVQYIQPWQFGHGEVKKTGLALHGLPRLTPTNIVDGREPKVWKMPPGPDRKRLRSKTYRGIAEAIASQWGTK